LGTRWISSGVNDLWLYNFHNFSRRYELNYVFWCEVELNKVKKKLAKLYSFLNFGWFFFKFWKKSSIRDEYFIQISHLGWISCFLNEHWLFGSIFRCCGCIFVIHLQQLDIIYCRWMLKNHLKQLKIDPRS
jgi:hypothetical protein